MSLSSRDIRQQQCISNWVKAKGRASIEAATGFGKTNIGLLIIKQILSKDETKRILVVVPTTLLKEQWIGQIDELGFGLSCDVQVINTIITHKWSTDLLIIDEVHRSAANELSKVFECVNYKWILGLTATFERLDGRQEIVARYCPICDVVSLTECLTNGWVSPYKEYLVLVDVDDLEIYNKANAEFNEHFEFFQWNFDLAMSCIGPNAHIAKANLRNEMCRNGTEEQKKAMFKTITYHAQRFNACMQLRKSFINNHPKKIELARKIIETRPFSKIVTFSNNVKMAESIGIGKVYTGKDSKKKGRTTIEDFNKETVGVLNTVKKADEGMNIVGLSVGIVIGTDSGKTKARQRLGRVIRAEANKKAEMFYIVINNTKEVSWFMNSHEGQPFITIDEEELDSVLAGNEPKPYKKKIQQQMFRY